MRKILFFAFILNVIAAITSAEPVFRFDSTKQADGAKKETPPPQRPAYYDAYKKVKNETPPKSEASQSSNSSTTTAAQDPDIPKSAIPETTRQMIQEQMKNIDPAMMQKAQEQMNKYSSPTNK